MYKQSDGYSCHRPIKKGEKYCDIHSKARKAKVINPRISNELIDEEFHRERLMSLALQVLEQVGFGTTIGFLVDTVKSITATYLIYEWKYKG